MVQHSTLVHNIHISCILHLSYQPFRDAAIATLHTFRNVFVLCVAAMCKISIGLRGRFSVRASVVALAPAGSWIFSGSLARSGITEPPCSYIPHIRKRFRDKTGLAEICILCSRVRFGWLLWLPWRFSEMRWYSLAVLKWMTLWLSLLHHDSW